MGVIWLLAGIGTALLARDFLRAHRVYKEYLLLAKKIEELLRAAHPDEADELAKLVPVCRWADARLREAAPQLKPFLEETLVRILRKRGAGGHRE